MVGTQTTLRQLPRNLPPRVWILYAGTFVNRYGIFVVYFLVLYIVRQGYSSAAPGPAASGYSVRSVANPHGQHQIGIVVHLLDPIWVLNRPLQRGRSVQRDDRF